MRQPTTPESKDGKAGWETLSAVGLCLFCWLLIPVGGNTQPASFPPNLPAASPRATSGPTPDLERDPEHPGIARLRSRALSGDRGACRDLGWHLFYGKSCRKAPSAAREWFERGAILGDGYAALHLGLFFRSGIGTRPHVGLSCWFLLQALQAGEPQAVFHLAEALSLSDTPRNVPLAGPLMEKALELGNPDAAYYLGLWSWEGTILPANRPRALALFRRAADANVGAALNWLGSHLVKVNSPDPVRADGIALLERGAYQGTPGAAYHLGMLYSRKPGFPRDFAKARFWLEKACEQNDPNGWNLLAWLLDHGLATGVLVPDAPTAFRRGAELDPVARVTWATCCERGEGCQPDPVEAWKWYTLAREDLTLQAEHAPHAFLQERLEALTRELTPDQLAEGQRRVQAWKALRRENEGLSRLSSGQ